ncbi:MAG TPA: cell division protein ZapA [Candidatus Scybalocola faecipullorum]|nr:cell division protein ZapA [Candidatus Scybalocola faecipullorum]
MSLKTDIQVLIGGKVYTLSGYESEEYLQKIALYINNKMEEMNEAPNYKRLNSDMQKILLEMNMADDFYKAKHQIEVLEADIEDKDKIEYDLKHELIASQIRLEDANKEIERLKNENNELQKQIVKLEAKTAAGGRRS